MEVTNAHARQALPLSLMEKPVIMVRFKRGRGGGGGGWCCGSTKETLEGHGGKAVLSICRILLDHRYTKKAPGAIASSKKIA